MAFPDCREIKERGATLDFKVNAVKLDREVFEGHVVGEAPTELLARKEIQASQEHLDSKEKWALRDQKDHVVLLDYPDPKETTEKMALREHLANGDLRVKMEIQDRRAHRVSLDRRVQLENQDR